MRQLIFLNSIILQISACSRNGRCSTTIRIGKEVKQVGLRQNHFVSITGGGEKAATFRISGGYDHETGSIIEQKLDRFTTRMMLDYYVSDRIKIISDFLLLTYTGQPEKFR